MKNTVAGFWEDLWIGYIMSPINEAVVSFKIARAVGQEMTGEFFYETPGSTHPHENPTQDLEKALIFMSGDIKFDGCSNIEFPESKEVMLHFCGLKETQKISEALKRLYALASEFMPDHKYYLLGEK